MRICFVSRRYWPAVSGMSAYAENLLRHLVAAGHEPTLVSQYRGDEAGRAVYGGGPPPADRIPDGVPVVALESLGEQAVAHGHPADFEADVRAMTDAVLDLHAATPFDVLHAQYSYPNGLAVLRAAHTTGLPAVVSVQGGDGHWVGTCCTTHRALNRAVMQGAPALLIGSDSFAAEVADRHDVDRARFAVIPGATDADRFFPAGPPGAVSDPAVLLYHGRIDARKGVLDLLDAVSSLLEHRRVRLLVSGIGPDTRRVAERIAELGLGEHVEVLGAVPYERAEEVYRRGEIFVSPTYAEGFSNTVLEAMASGLPVVSTDVVGVRDCVRDDENGVLVPAGEPAALATALARLIDDAPRRRRLAECALDEVRRRWSWPVVAARITGVYDEVIARGAGVAAIEQPAMDPECRFRAAPHLL
ncbi:glycosyltransferase involved in cell wall biosynthesis [Pseudonocardia sediminis]|uniref:Glycosyltransferase involved in cell wall biosynthesis n=1 Tax=Pseudonocardia sediminis TaxID=1397368 RepID=A0A4Q7UXN0_PSEST|nr:glycosyltransferase family 4 protein [Pseudonocardia sediminis]RZT85701.1 glycosyltransferase involved in cell wall biosynthesis [Pseudonocardia sediminis]